MVSDLIPGAGVSVLAALGAAGAAAAAAGDVSLTFSLGDLVQIATTAGGGVGIYVALRERLVKIETMIEPLWEDYQARRRRADAD